MFPIPCQYWLSRVFLIVFLILFPFHFSDLRAAEKKDETTKKSKNFTSKKKEAWMKAQDYSLKKPVIAFSVYGRTPDMTCKQIGEKIKGLFKKVNGINSEYFPGKENRMGVSVSFFIKGEAYGPVPISKAVPLMREVATHYREALPDQVAGNRLVPSS